MTKKEDKINIPLNIVCFLAFLIGNFALFRQDFIWQFGAMNYSIYLVSGIQSVVLLFITLRSTSRRIKHAALARLVACILGFIFEIMLLVNHIGIFGLRVGFS